jgi:hypothetical protein
VKQEASRVSCYFVLVYLRYYNVECWDYELEIMWKEAVVAYFKVLSLNLSARTAENSQIGWYLSQYSNMAPAQYVGSLTT